MSEPAFAIQLPDSLIGVLVERAAELAHARVRQHVDDSPYMTTEQAAAFLCCSRQRVHDLLGQGKLSRYKEGRRTLLLREELDRLVQLDRRRRTQ